MPWWMSLGVKAANIYIYDGVHGSKMGRDTPFGGLPKGVRVVDQWGGISTPVAVPSPWDDPSGKSEIVKPLADGTVDILVNIALCKGHWTNYGGFTMAMKNHMGTFSPSPVHRDGAQDYLLAVNKTPEILGSMDKKTGKVLYPRQQLCLLDALWAEQGRADGLPEPSAQLPGHGRLRPRLRLHPGHPVPRGENGLEAEYAGDETLSQRVRVR